MNNQNNDLDRNHLIGLKFNYVKRLLSLSNTLETLNKSDKVNPNANEIAAAIAVEYSDICDSIREVSSLLSGEQPEKNMSK